MKTDRSLVQLKESWMEESQAQMEETQMMKIRAIGQRKS